MTDEKKRIVLPGEHIASYEEAEPGENTYSKDDEVYSGALGQMITEYGKAVVKTKHRLLEQPFLGMEIYGVVSKTSLNNALVDCVSVSEISGKGRGLHVSGALPVSEIGKGYVEDIRSEVKVGDIIKARVIKLTKNGVELSIAPPGFGIVQPFCPKCRQAMYLKGDGDIFICGNCGWKERRKTIHSQPVARGPRASFGSVRDSRGFNRNDRGPNRSNNSNQRRRY